MHIDALCNLEIDGKKYWCFRECCTYCGLRKELEDGTVACSSGRDHLPMRGGCTTYNCIEDAGDREIARIIIGGMKPGLFKMEHVKFLLKIAKAVG